MQTVRNITMLVALGLAAAAPLAQQHDSHGRQHASTAADQAVGSHLPPRLRGLLIQEMMSLLDASKQILDALVRGDDKAVARNAQGIHDSFILAQEMTETDRQTLHGLSHAFLQKDQALHALAEKLAEAARVGDQRAQHELFSEMINACASCHAAHATDRFPDLRTGMR